MANNGLRRREFLGIAGGVTAGTLLGQNASAASKGTNDCDNASTELVLTRNVPVLGQYDVVVCGGGPSGCAAALSARRSGLSVLVLESQGQLGGNGTSGLVSHWLGGRTSNCQNWVVGGIFRTLVEEAASRGIALIPSGNSKKKYQPHGWYKGQLEAGIPFDPFGMAAYLDQKLANADVNVLLLTQAFETTIVDRRITHVMVVNKSGLGAIAAEAVVDATGDADIAARSGCDCVKGRDEDGMMTPTSLIFHVDNVNQDTLDECIHQHNSPRFREKIAELRKAGEWPFPYDIFISVQLHEEGTMMINTTRLVGIDGTQGSSLSEGMIRGRSEVQQLMALMREHFPGFQEARLKCVAPVLGVRETRRLCAKFVLSVHDLNQGKNFDDTIGFSAYGWDLPNPKHPSDNPQHGRKRPVTPIPYRTMIPVPIENLICPGRAISVERPVLGPLRVMAPCMAMGEAAGQAAAQVVRNGVSFGNIDLLQLRNELKEKGALL